MMVLSLLVSRTLCLVPELCAAARSAPPMKPRVIDSRLSEDGDTVRRRRECEVL